MANEQNLVKGDDRHKFTLEEASKGGKASAEARRRKRDLRKALETLLEKDFYDNNGNAMTGTEAISTRLFEQAMKGNIKAFEVIRSTVGQDPIQKVEQTVSVTDEAREEVQRFLDSYEDE